MKYILFIIVSFFILLLSSCGQNQQNANLNSRPLTYEEQVKSVSEIERESPLKFLKVENFSWKSSGIFFIDYYANGTVVNDATVAEYKDVNLQIVYQTKTNTELSRENHIIYEFFPPHSQKNFSFKIVPPRDCERVSVIIASATPTP
jgi:hypothetical protein